MCNLSSGVLAKGMEIGREEGLKVGRAKGRAEGRVEERAEMIRSMLLENDLTVEKIAKYAKVTVEEVRKIQAEMKNEA